MLQLMSVNTQFQSTLPARGATIESVSCSPPFLISIHTPRAGSDDGDAMNRIASIEFQSTLPARGATELRWTQADLARNFNPHSPRGERQQNSLSSAPF